MSAFCKACSAPILWAKTPAGKAMPLNADRDPDGNVELRDGVAHVVGKAAPKLGERYMPHHATRPKVGLFREGTT